MNNPNNLEPTQYTSPSETDADGNVTTSSLVAPPTKYILAGIGIILGFVVLCLLLGSVLSRSGAATPATTASIARPSVQALSNPTPGVPFAVQGSGFAPNEKVEIFLVNDVNAPASQYVKVGEAQANADGSFTRDGVTIAPERAGNGRVFLVARGSASGVGSFNNTQLNMNSAAAPPPTAIPQTQVITPTTAPAQAATPVPAVATIPPTVATLPPNTNLPDLIVGSVSIGYQPGVDCLLQPQLGVLAEVRNVGNVASPPFVVNINNNQLAVQSGLQPNQTVQLWAAGYGNGVNKITVDPSNAVAELNRQNNVVALNLVVPTTAPQCRATAEPTTPPDPNANGVWIARYFNNVDLEEPAVLTRYEMAGKADSFLNLDFKNAAPAAGVNADNFSATYIRRENFPSTDSYEFTLTVDDGARVYIDGVKVRDEWFNGGVRTMSFNASVAKGMREIRVEHYDAGGNARIALSWKVKYVGWTGRYYNTTDRSGPIVMKRDDPDINFDWGFGSPDGAMNSDNFSVDWQRTVNLPGGTYQFTADIDDGMRVLVDNQIVLDYYTSGSKVVSATRVLAAGNHFIQVQYVEYGGSAKARLTYVAVTPPTAVPTIAPPPTLAPLPSSTLPPPPSNTPLAPTLPPPVTDTPAPVGPTPVPPSPTATIGGTAAVVTSP